MTILIFDATDEGPDQALIDVLRSRYWVLRYNDELAKPRDWLMSPGHPIDVVNGRMKWVRPSYEEILIHLDGVERGRGLDGHLSKFRSTDLLVRVCSRCGHREDSHGSRGCRATCGCFSFQSKDGTNGE